MAFASIVRFDEVVNKFFHNRMEVNGWSKEDVVHATQMLLDGHPPLLVEAEIEAEIHGTVTWNQCPLCRKALSDEDKNRRAGLCPTCFPSESAGFVKMQVCEKPGDHPPNKKTSHVKKRHPGHKQGPIRPSQ
jgi:hypothetical protein